ncbi:MAG: leucine-rich repeat protein [Oscillospiraceae bacterium]|nr:leucine-rich repeat protein [Oscillospiraceae bacterium]
MKHGKFITWLSAAVLGISAAVACSAGMTANAAQGTGETDTWTYTYDTVTNQATVTGYKGQRFVNVTIPQTLGGYTVTGIGNRAFWQKYLTGITIPGTVTTIGKDAFGWNRMQSISIPSGVTSLPEGVFWYCYYMTSATLPNVTSVGNGAFYHCSGLTTVSAPKVKTIGNNAFDNCTALNSISLPKTETIGSGCFYKCTGLTAASMPLVKTIGNNSFFECSLLSNLSMPKIQTIGEQAFMKCSSLLTLSLPVSTTSVGINAFADCTSITSLQISGPAVLRSGSFKNCSALTSVQLSAASYTDRSYCAFSYCPYLTKVNGIIALSYQTDSNGKTYPVLNPALETPIRNHFARSAKVKFVDDYCTQLCNYIVETETDPWMNDALKTRQLHDWIVRHCEYENGGNGEAATDSENHVASSVFLSYAFNIRGIGIGETVCEGYAKALTMLLATADIESYRIHSTSHQWNIVNIDGTYYQVDVTWDDPIPYGGGDNTHSDPYSTCYEHFLKSRAEMDSLHGSVHHNPTPATDGNYEHALLTRYTGNIAELMTQCNSTYMDYNEDGILDYDLDLDGNAFQPSDWDAYGGVLQFSFGYCSWETFSDKSPEVLYRLHRQHKSFWISVNTSAPTSQTAAAGTTAVFKAAMLAGDLTYQWMYKNAGGQWVNASYTGATTDTLYVPANASTNGMKFGLIVYGKNGNCLYSNELTLTVV